MLFGFFAFSMAGSVTMGQINYARTSLTLPITENTTTITVKRTTGFPDKGILNIGAERVAYSDTSATTFTGSLAQPIVRGAQETTATAHVVGEKVSTVEGSMFNSSLDYNIALLSDSSGLMMFVSGTLVVFQVLASFFTAPLHWLGSDLQILTYIWAIFGIGGLIAIVVQMAGGRRV